MVSFVRRLLGLQTRVKCVRVGCDITVSGLLVLGVGPIGGMSAGLEAYVSSCTLQYLRHGGRVCRDASLTKHKASPGHLSHSS